MASKGIKRFPPLRCRTHINQDLYSFDALLQWEQKTVMLFLPTARHVINFTNQTDDTPYGRLIVALQQWVTYRYAWVLNYDVSYFCYFIINYFDDMCRAVIL